jgi:hypothetical protein
MVQNYMIKKGALCMRHARCARCVAFGRSARATHDGQVTQLAVMFSRCRCGGVGDARRAGRQVAVMLSRCRCGGVGDARRAGHAARRDVLAMSLWRRGRRPTGRSRRSP